MPSQFEKLQKLTQELASLADHAHLIHNEVEGLRNAEEVRQSQAEAAPEFVPMSWQEAERIMLGVGENGEIICYSQTIRHCASSYIRLLDAVKEYRDCYPLLEPYEFTPPSIAAVFLAAGIKD